MSENSKDSVEYKSLEDRIIVIWDYITELKGSIKGFEDRIRALEVAKGEHGKDIERMFDAINTIEKNIAKIADALELLTNKSGHTYDKLKYEVLKCIVIAILVVIASALSKLILGV